MATSKITYTGDLRTVSVHLKSGNEIITDAPTDNHGKGEAFSPTDLVCAALGSCMVTIMGIVADREGVSLKGLSWEITKIMQANPRKIQEVIVNFTWANPVQDAAFLQKIKNAARTCPVALSLDPAITQTVTFDF